MNRIHKIKKLLEKIMIRFATIIIIIKINQPINVFF